MNIKNSKKLLIFPIFLAVFGAAFLNPSFIFAQDPAYTVQQLQEQIERLQAQIAVLQQQLKEAVSVGPQPGFPALEEPKEEPVPIPRTCPIFTYNLYRGAKDENTAGEVTKIQRVLAADPTVYPEGLITGYYGSLTEKAVQKWQAKQNIVSSGSAGTTGYGVVGPRTREKITIACPLPLPISAITVLSPNGGEQWALGSNQTIQWSSGRFSIEESYFPKIAFVDIDLLSWNYSCQPGGSEEICLMGATDLSPVRSIALVRKAANTGSFFWTVGKNISGATVPAGSYIVRVSNSENSREYDQSDALFNIVKESSGNLPPSISGVSGPTVLSVGETGKWEVKASDPEQGPLTYSVVWGDETVDMGISERAISSMSPDTTQTATFTHTYSKSGIYSPIFTVTDNGGLSAKTSISVNVGNGSNVNSIPVINGFPAIPIDIKAGQSVSFSWGAIDADNDNLSWSVSWGDGTGLASVCQSPNPQQKEGWNFSAAHSWSSSGVYTVKATVNDCRGGSDEHAFNVTVGNISQSFIQVFAPNGGETWVKGTTQTIKWQDNTPQIQVYPPPTRYYDIKLFTYYPPCTGSVCPMYPYVAPYTIANAVYGTSYNWPVGKVLDLYGRAADTVIPESSYIIQVCQTGSATCDSSDSYFKIAEEYTLF